MKVLVAAENPAALGETARAAAALLGTDHDFTVLGVVPSSDSAFLDERTVQDAEGERERAAEPGVDAADDALDHHVELRGVVEGNPATEVIRLAGDGGYDAVVLGVEPPRWLRRIVSGSVLDEVVRNVPCPVVGIRSSAPRPGASAA